MFTSIGMLGCYERLHIGDNRWQQSGQTDQAISDFLIDAKVIDLFEQLLEAHHLLSW